MIPQPDPILSRLRNAMSLAGLDGAVTTSPDNVTYVSGARIPSQRLVRSRLSACVVPCRGESVLVTVGLEGELAREQSRLDDLLLYEEFAEDPIELVARALKASGSATRTVGLEMTHLSVSEYERLRRALPGLIIEPIDELLERLRMVKTHPEIERLRRIGRTAELIIRDACAAVQPGDTERKLGTIISELFGERGGDALTMLVIASGPRSAQPNGPPTSRTMNEGELVRVDLIGTADGYYCDVGRTAVVGEPTPRQEEIYGLLRDVHREAFASLGPGVTGAEIYRIYSEAMKQTGLPAYHFVGHGLGISLHEQPFLNPRGTTPLQEDMVICVEPLTFVSGEFGVQIEDEAVITADGCQMLTQADAMPIIGA